MEKLEANSIPKQASSSEENKKLSQEKLKKKLDETTLNRDRVKTELRRLDDRRIRIGNVLTLMKNKLDILELFLKKHHFGDKLFQVAKNKSDLSTDEVDKHQLHFQMRHGSKNLAKEKQLLKETKATQQRLSPAGLNDSTIMKYRQTSSEIDHIKVAEDRLTRFQSYEIWERERRSFNANSLEEKFQSSLCSRRAIRDQMKGVRIELDEFEKKYQTNRLKTGLLKLQLEALEKEINCLKKQLPDMDPSKDEALAN